ncbi:MAG: hypothetical protein P8O10_12300 [Pseudorhodobacter sp.]|nr:hypothetical protein [Pseudorhodobacter sp.]
MKPNFALNITDSGLALLRRTSRGWMPVGDVAFDSPDLAEALGYLRSSALGLSPHGITTKIVLPASQVLYLEVEAPSGDKTAREGQIRKALEGRTPYAVDDLVFDYWGSGSTVKVAVTARETLEEAEAFAVEHRLNPVSFVTIPGPGQFGAEPFFGATSLAPKLLPLGERVTRDQDPLVILSREAVQEALAEEAAKRREQEAAAQKEKAEAEAKAEAERQKAEEAKAKEAAAKAEEEARLAAEAEAKAAAEAKAKAEAAAQKAAAAKPAATEAPADTKAKAETASKDATPPNDKGTEGASKSPADDQAGKPADPAPEPATDPAPEAKSSFVPKLPKADSEAKAMALAALESKRIAAEAARLKAAVAESMAQRTKAFADQKSLIAQERARALAAPPEPSEPETGSTKPTSPDSDADSSSETDAPLPSFSSRRRDLPASAPKLGPAVAAPVAKAAPRFGLSAPKQVSPEPAPADPVAAKTPAASAAIDDVPPMPSLVAARLKEAPPAPKPKADAPGLAAQMAPLAEPPKKRTPIPPLPTAQMPEKPGADKPSTKDRLANLVTASRIPVKSLVSRPKAKTKPADQPAQAAVAPISAFGKKLERPRGKPRFLGLILTGILLVVLALIAAWSSIYLSRDDTAPAVTEVAIASPDAIEVPSPEPVALPEEMVSIDPEMESDLAATGDDLPPEIEATPVEEAVAAALPEPPAPEPAVAEVIGPQPETPTIEIDRRRMATGAGQDEIFLATSDTPPPAFDAVSLPRPETAPDAAPVAAMPPPPPGTLYEFDADGRIKATETGVVTPEGFWLIAARPSPEPPPRPEAISGPEVALPATEAPLPEAADQTAAASTAALPEGTSAEATTAQDAAPIAGFQPDSTIETLRPPRRPASEDPTQVNDDAALTTEAGTRITSLRPKLRPASILAQANAARDAAAAASLASAPTALSLSENAADLPVPVSLRPSPRPQDFSKAVAAAVASATRSAPPVISNEVDEQNEPEVTVSASAAPRIPSSASVARQATFKNAIDLGELNLIGVYGTASNRYALVRSANGRFSKVKVGDRVDGGTVAAITNSELRYRKGSKMLSLSMPKG